VEPLDIWRVAKLMLDKHSDEAPLQCALKADAFLENGDTDGQRLWLAIRRAARSLLQNGQPTDIQNT
jgi:hypothetical protein